MAKEKKCECCGILFGARDAAQRYCQAVACQRYRKREWQKRKLAIDPAYQGNTADAQRRWRERHPDYWRDYRASHPKYVERNRQLQRRRNKQRRVHPGVDGSTRSAALIAKMDAGGPIKSGTYRLIPLGMIAKMDAVEVELSVISGTYG